jgi:6-phosphogluconolactonase (cycloisomerase 2 family)
MKVARWAWMMLAATPFLGGCKDFWQAPPTSCTSNCPTTTSGNFYILNQGVNQIAAYNIASGTLTAIAGSPYTLSSKPYAVAIAPNNGGFLYVSTVSGIYLYAIDSSTGALTLGNSNGVISQDFATTMQVDSTGSWLVEAGPDLGAKVIAIPINPTTGLLATGGTEKIANIPASTIQQLVISPDNGNVFLALGSAGTVIVPFTAANTNPFGATYTKIAAKNTGGSALSVAVDPQNRVFYVGETLANSAANSGGLRVFNYASLPGAPAEVSGSPYASGGLAPHAILPDLSGDYAYVANWATGGDSAGNIAGFTLVSSASTYSLTAGSTFSAGVDPVGLAEDNTKTYVLAVSTGGGPDLQAFTFDTTTLGKLDSALTAATGTDPVQAAAIAAAP